MNPIIYKQSSAQLAFLIKDNGTHISVDVRKVEDSDGIIKSFKDKKFKTLSEAKKAINKIKI